MVDVLLTLAPSPALLWLIVFGVALLESLALIGLMVPGVVLITAAAAMAGHQALAAGFLVISAFAGAVLGDALSFHLGYREQGRIKTRWPFTQHPEWLARGSRFFARYGGRSVFLGRFIGPVRPLVPLIAGMMQMSPARFMVANLSSAALWAPLYVLPGYWLGHAWYKAFDLPEGMTATLILLITTLVLMGSLFSFGSQSLSSSSKRYQRLMPRLRTQPGYRRLWPLDDVTPFPLSAFTLLLIVVILLMGLTLVVIQGAGPLPIDQLVQRFMIHLKEGPLYALSGLLALAGDRYGIAALMLPWLTWMLLQGAWRLLATISAALAGIATLNTLGKAIIGRARPSTPDHLLDSMAYPSAHTSTAVVVFGLAAAFAAAALPAHRRHWVYWPAILLCGVMALSRLVLDVHWVTDVIAGALLGLAVCAVTRIVWQRQRYPEPLPNGLGTLTGLVAMSLVLVSMRIAWLELA